MKFKTVVCTLAVFVFVSCDFFGIEEEPRIPERNIATHVINNCSNYAGINPINSNDLTSENYFEFLPLYAGESGDVYSAVVLEVSDFNVICDYGPVFNLDFVLTKTGEAQFTLSDAPGFIPKLIGVVDSITQDESGEITMSGTITNNTDGIYKTHATLHVFYTDNTYTEHSFGFDSQGPGTYPVNRIIDNVTKTLDRAAFCFYTIYEIPDDNDDPIYFPVD